MRSLPRLGWQFDSNGTVVHYKVPPLEVVVMLLRGASEWGLDWEWDQYNVHRALIKAKLLCL